nr:hypothetical protein [uncultured Albidiferax sp.]
MTVETHTNVLVRMRNELKADLQREAVINDRKLTQEINVRLIESLKATPLPAPAPRPHPMHQPHTATVLHTNEKGPGEVLSDLDRAMLRVFHGLPPEKQLALLSLFKN